MPRTPVARDEENDVESRRDEQVASASTTAGSITRQGFSTPGVEFEDGQADHRQDLSTPEGNGGMVRDGVIEGTSMEEDPNRPDTDPPVGPMWIQKLPGES